MIVHELKCVFVHIPKCAGQSVEALLLQHLGLDWEKDRAPFLLRPCTDKRFGPERLAHLTARQYVDCGHMTAQQYDSYFKFAVIRNTWDRVRSMYVYFYDIGAINLTFPHWLRESLKKVAANGDYFFLPQTAYLTDGKGQTIVDDIIAFERLSDGIARIAERLDLSCRSLPHRNRSDAFKNRPLPAYEWTQADIDFIAALYPEDIDRFGHEPPAQGTPIVPR